MRPRDPMAGTRGAIDAAATAGEFGTVRHWAPNPKASLRLAVLSCNAASPARNLYRVERKLINLGFGYQLRPTLNVTLDIDNLTNVPQKRYRGTPDNVEHFNHPGTTITVGINGRF